jgi:hypothetical protein
MTKIVDNFDQVINDIKRKLSDDGVKRRTLAYIANAEIARIKDRTQNKGKDFRGIHSFLILKNIQEQR